MIKYVYVAGPYSAPTEEAVAENVARAMDMGDAIDDAGLVSFVPHLSHFRHQRRRRDYEEWMEIDFAWLKKCDALVRLPGQSSGADREIIKAQEWEIPVFDSLRDLLRANQ